MTWILIVLIVGSVQTQTHMQTHVFKTKEACEQAAEFLKRNPYPALNVDTICIAEKVD